MSAADPRAVQSQWQERHASAWVDRGVRNAPKYARIVIDNRLGQRKGLSMGPFSFGSGNVGAVRSREIREEIRDQVDELMIELGLIKAAPGSEAAHPLRHVGPTQRAILRELVRDVSLTPAEMADRHPEISRDAVRSAMLGTSKRGWTTYTEEGPPSWRTKRYILTDEGRRMAAMVEHDGALV